MVYAKFAVAMDADESMLDVRDRLADLVRDGPTILNGYFVKDMRTKLGANITKDATEAIVTFQPVDNMTDLCSGTFITGSYSKGKGKGKGDDKDDDGDKPLMSLMELVPKDDNKGKGTGDIKGRKRKGVYANMSEGTSTSSSSIPSCSTTSMASMRLKEALNKMVLSDDFKPEEYNMDHFEAEAVKAVARAQLGL